MSKAEEPQDHDEFRRPQNLSAVVEVARETTGRVGEARAAGQLPPVVGCTVELGTVANLLPSEGPLGLLYFDLNKPRHADAAHTRYPNSKERPQSDPARNV